MGSAARHGDDIPFCAPFLASARRRGFPDGGRRSAARARLLRGDRRAPADRRRDRRRRRARAPALGARRAPVFRGAGRGRRRGLRDLRLPAQRFARILAIARTVGRRLAVRSGRGDDCADRLCRRLDHGPHRRLSRTAAHRGVGSDRGALPVQPAHGDRRRLAHGRDRRAGDRARRPAVSRPGRDRARARACGSSARRC